MDRTAERSSPMILNTLIINGKLLWSYSADPT